MDDDHKQAAAIAALAQAIIADSDDLADKVRDAHRVGVPVAEIVEASGLPASLIEKWATSQS